ncbi:MAG: SDR family NAD(P)-dependent oxidoreductase, partial [Chloroflexota bacterium]
VRQDLLDEVIGAITQAGGTVIWVRADVSVVDDARRIADETIAAFGGIDILVNNAAIERYGTVVEMAEDDWDRVIAVNLRGVYLMSRFCIPSMVGRGGGSVVHVASVQAFTCLPRSAAYVATKGAVVALTRAMALDHAHEKVRVNCVCPGSIETPLLRHAAEQEANPEAMFAEWASKHPIGRIGKPEEVAQVILFLAGDQSSFVTGSPYLVDGALSAAAWW